MKCLTICATALLGIGMVGFTGCKDDEVAQNQPPKTPGQKVDAATQKLKEGADDVNAALASSGTADPKGIRNTIEGVVTNALDPDNFNDMTTFFVDADHKRLDQTKPDTKDLDAAVKEFLKKWDDKYKDTSFKIKDADAMYPEAFMKLNTEGTANMLKGSATIAKSHGFGELKVSVVGQDGKWKIDLDDSIDGKKVHDTLLEATNELNKDFAQLPADKTEAYRHVTHRIMMAVLNK